MDGSRPCERLAYEAADAGWLNPELAASIRRLKGVRKLGVRLGNWRTAEEARRFWQAFAQHAQNRPVPDSVKVAIDQSVVAADISAGGCFAVVAVLASSGVIA